MSPEEKMLEIILTAKKSKQQGYYKIGVGSVQIKNDIRHNIIDLGSQQKKIL